jgi:hypothetical protein
VKHRIAACILTLCVAAPAAAKAAADCKLQVGTITNDCDLNFADTLVKFLCQKHPEPQPSQYWNVDGDRLSLETKFGPQSSTDVAEQLDAQCPYKAQVQHTEANKRANLYQQIVATKFALEAGKEVYRLDTAQQELNALIGNGAQDPITDENLNNIKNSLAAIDKRLSQLEGHVVQLQPPGGGSSNELFWFIYVGIAAILFAVLAVFLTLIRGQLSKVSESMSSMEKIASCLEDIAAELKKLRVDDIQSTLIELKDTIERCDKRSETTATQLQDLQALVHNVKNTVGPLSTFKDEIISGVHSELTAFRNNGALSVTGNSQQSNSPYDSSEATASNTKMINVREHIDTASMRAEKEILDCIAQDYGKMLCADHNDTAFERSYEPQPCEMDKNGSIHISQSQDAILWLIIKNNIRALTPSRYAVKQNPGACLNPDNGEMAKINFDKAFDITTVESGEKFTLIRPALIDGETMKVKLNGRGVFHFKLRY